MTLPVADAQMSAIDLDIQDTPFEEWEILNSANAVGSLLPDGAFINADVDDLPTVQITRNARVKVRKYVVPKLYGACADRYLGLPSMDPSVFTCSSATSKTTNRNAI